MTTPADFEKAAALVKNLKQTPRKEELLKLYACYKQGTEGDVQGKRPGMLDLKGRAKYDAWAALQGTPPSDAQQKYVALVAELQKRYG
jgi:diazepam-binding inhibitor (GABA receptor modulating acyl-CoA-binding protein)